VSDDALEIARAWFDTWNRGDMDAFAELYAIDAEMTPDPTWVEAGTFVGRAAIREFFEGLTQSWDGQGEAAVRKLFRSGDWVVFHFDWKVRGRASGIDTQLEITTLNTIEGRSIVRQHHYFDHAAALAVLERGS
jgi:ketosteroid isomerase-like protein